MRHENVCWAYAVVVAGALSMLAGNAHAQQVRVLKRDADSVTYLNVGTDNFRLGNYVVFYTATTIVGGDDLPPFHGVFSYAIGCNTSTIKGLRYVKGSSVKRPLEALSLALKERPYDEPGVVGFQEIPLEKQAELRKQLAPHLADLCSLATREPRNKFIFITTTDEPTETHALVTGSVSRSKSRITAWFQSNPYTVIPEKNPDGTPKMLLGSIPDERVEIGKERTLNRRRFDCRERSSDLLQTIKYSRTGTPFDSNDYSHLPETFTAVVPNSVGEAMLDFLCDVY
jgi:hypothetical protein